VVAGIGGHRLEGEKEANVRFKRVLRFAHEFQEQKYPVCDSSGVQEEGELSGVR
jgi:hypothetical protein